MLMRQDNSEEALAHWLALLRTPGVGPRRFQALCDHFDSPQQVFDLSSEELKQLGLPAHTRQQLKNPPWSAVERDLAWQQPPNREILTLHDPRYPALLKEIADPPPLLFVQGDTTLLSYPQLAMVGSRNPSSSGRRNAYEISQALTASGLLITSGLALGIDGVSHQAALAWHNKRGDHGATIAVIGSGLDRIYPSAHHKLAQQISAQGALISEFPLGTPPLAKHFPRRNRIISGLSLGVLVVEAALRSGSLITARLAAEQGREVFALPGSIHNPQSRGCHALIRQGAKLVEGIDEIMEELQPLARFNHNATQARLAKPMPKPAPEPTQQPTPLDRRSQEILAILSHDPISVDHLVKQSRLTAEALSSILLVMELEGLVTSSAGGFYTRADR